MEDVRSKLTYLCELDGNYVFVLNIINLGDKPIIVKYGYESISVKNYLESSERELVKGDTDIIIETGRPEENGPQETINKGGIATISVLVPCSSIQKNSKIFENNQAYVNVYGIIIKSNGDRSEKTDSGETVFQIPLPPSSKEAK